MEKQTIDLTPTWVAMLPVLLDIYAAHQKKIKSSYKITAATQISINTCNEIAAEFKKMAQAADNWNEHTKAAQK